MSVNQSRLTRTLLAGGALAGPLYIAVALLQMPFREGFDPTRHDWSLLANGSFGWVQSANLIISGLLVVGGAVGLRRTLGSKGRGTLWGPLGLALYGLGLVGAGIFAADPMQGFPDGTPVGPPADATLHGLLHVVTAGVGFLALIAACFVLGRRFSSLQRKAMSRFSFITGFGFLAGFMGVAASGAQLQGVGLQIVTLAFTAAVVLAWSWVSIIFSRASAA